jgi:hypothetical protein
MLAADQASSSAALVAAALRQESGAGIRAPGSSRSGEG